jgi:hypothetical protein
MCTTNGHAFACGCGYKDSRRPGLPPVLGLGPNDTERRTIPVRIPVLEHCDVVACGWVCFFDNLHSCTNTKLDSSF